MSETDSFIEEVTEEVRRDRLFALMKRYGWIAVLAILLLVGGAAINEWRKAQARAEAEATGDAMIAALRSDDAGERAAALAALSPESQGARALAALLAAGEQVEAGQTEQAAATFESVAGNADLPLIYRQVASYKRLAILGDTLSFDERRAGYEALVGPGSQLRLLAEEQLALIDIETGDTASAAGRLQAIASDAAVTAGLRQRATQLMVALGETPEAIPGAEGETGATAAE
ncbi:tetratricopeptide repeat protein [Marimonas arenosa]|uniref:Tetratricopeptide repeat protein n=1 Tax=Marimonas arenosa TaxID=1795305 RepID=A0AAE3WCN5_9RHOB|nr:tetratricopeptide repeat protein [Marimonas arenosa]MDQ2089188.1 tetratricopeptide repeat protein [Marimonas arenosa]